MAKPPEPHHPDWAYIADPVTREWLQSLPIAEQLELHGRHPDHLQREHGDRIAAEVFALSGGPSDLPADFDNWDEDQQIAWFNARAAEAKAAYTARTGIEL